MRLTCMTRSTSSSSFPWSLFPPLPMHCKRLSPPVSGRDDDAIVFVQGMLSFSSNWLSIAGAVRDATSSRVLLPDARNHGRSPHSPDHSYRHLASDLKKFLADNDLSSATLVGHSMGARTAMLLALLCPDSVKKLAVLDTSPVHPTPEEGVRLMRLRLDAMAAVDMKTIPAGATADSARTEVDGQLTLLGVKRETMRRALLMNLRRDPATGTFSWQVNVEVLRTVLAEQMLLVPERERWMPFEGETLFLGGQLSGYIPIDGHEQIREFFPNASFDYVSNAGHWLYQENQPEFLQKLLPFLK